MTVISARERHDVSSRLMELRHLFDENVFGNMHLHLSGGHCVEIYIIQGESERVLDFVSRVRAVRGIKEVNYTMTPIEGAV